MRLIVDQLPAHINLVEVTAQLRAWGLVPTLARDGTLIGALPRPLAEALAGPRPAGAFASALEERIRTGRMPYLPSGEPERRLGAPV